MFRAAPEEEALLLRVELEPDRSRDIDDVQGAEVLIGCVGLVFPVEVAGVWLISVGAGEEQVNVLLDMTLQSVVSSHDRQLATHFCLLVFRRL